MKNEKSGSRRGWAPGLSAVTRCICVIFALTIACLAHGVTLRRPNVVLLLTDDQRYDELGCTGLKNDPGENRNLAGEPQHAARLETMRKRCVELQRTSLDRDPGAPLPSQTWESWRAEMKEFYSIFKQ